MNELHTGGVTDAKDHFKPIFVSSLLDIKYRKTSNRRDSPFNVFSMYVIHLWPKPVITLTLRLMMAYKPKYNYAHLMANKDLISSFEIRAKHFILIDVHK